MAGAPHNIQVEYSEAKLRSAFETYRLRSWPASFEETMADPLRARLVKLHAWLMVHRPVKPRMPLPARTPAPERQAPPRPAERQSAPHPTLQLSLLPVVDRKRAAAGDRDD